MNLKTALSFGSSRGGKSILISGIIIQLSASSLTQVYAHVLVLFLPSFQGYCESSCFCVLGAHEGLLPLISGSELIQNRKY